METKSFKVEFKEINEAGEFVAYISTKSIDSYNDRVLPTAFKRTIDHNKGTFPILWMHDASKPIGVSTHMVMDNGGVKAYGKINLDTELGKEVYSGMKFSPPYIDRTSIGFVSVDDEFNSKTNIRTIKELKLLEFSLITKNFAANTEALVSSVKSKADLDARLKKLEKLESKSGMEESLDKVMSRLKRLEAYLDMEEDGEDQEGSDDPMDEEDSVEMETDACGTRPKKKDIVEEELEEKEANSSKTLGRLWGESLLDTLFMEEKAVSGDTSLPLAEKEYTWSGPEAKKRIFEWAGGDDFDPSKAKKAFFYYDKENDRLKSSYKLPFADVIDGELVAIPKALSSVKGALDGARGTGVDIPSADKDAIMKKVMSYQEKDSEGKSDELLIIASELKKMLEEEKELE